MKKLLYETTAGNPKKLIRPIILSTLSELINFLPTIFIFWALQIILKAFLDKSPPNASLLWGIGVFLVLFLAVMMLFEILAYRALYRSAYGVSAIGRIELAKDIAKLPLGYLESKDPGSLSYVLMSNYASLETALSHKLPICIANTIVPIIVFIGLLLLNYQMAIAMFICLPLSLISLWLTQIFIAKLGAKQQQAKRESENRLQEYLDGIKVIKAYGLVGAKFSRLLESFEALRRSSLRLEILSAPLVMTSLAFVGAGLGIMIFMGRYLMLEGALDIFTFIAFLMIGTKAFVPFSTSAIAYAESKYFQKAGHQILELKSQPPQSGAELPPKDYHIEFKNVSFSYQNTPVLKNISLQIPPNQFIALTGPSGGGKSTILKLIARFYDPNEGSIYFGGKDIKTLDPQAYRQNLSMVFQNVYLFADTIANNIALGRENASISQIMEVCKKANCTEFITHMPQGLQTPITSKGDNLSGGQKQRIGIARALLKDSPIILLDEFSAALDALNELKIQQAINALIQNKTIIAIAHKLKTIQNAHTILYIAQGQIQEQGSHQELLDLNGQYAKLWRLQNP
ncbi:hypothetical protein BKH46_05045 [Helicobacter sp. 12S02634-8]|uniref:ABC transporter ATP-binding protein n=1 Tax=Helicobacter sp. 12S02634-8 TaxID=1476199 RepID=UPI000BA754B6|nr:ABC transporter ATP-binding protein [Helicobacter sp. 12S02634-8]PAF47086.1 hypothetical protein BKH46_05045 [Helicobacter sp. 12S02634-8]